MAARSGGPALVVAVLAAGLASRFGAAKQEQSCAGRPLGAWALDTALSLGAPVIVVTRAGAEGFLGVHRDRVRTVTNPAPERGMGHSVALAAAEAKGMGAGALLVTLADMPLVRRETLAALVSAASAHGLAATCYPGGRRGVPACFSHRMFAALGALEGDAGARDLLRSCPDAALIARPEEELADVDTPDDLARIAGLLARGRGDG